MLLCAQAFEDAVERCSLRFVKHRRGRGGMGAGQLRRSFIDLPYHNINESHLKSFIDKFCAETVRSTVTGLRDKGVPRVHNNTKSPAAK